MNPVEIMKRKLKKRTLILKSAQASNLRALNTSLETLLDNSDFECVPPNEALSLHLLLLEKNMFIHRNADSKLVKHFEISFKNSFELPFTNSDDSAVYFLPINWQEKGALIIKYHMFVKNFDFISYLYDDDFYLFNEEVSSTVALFGDRTGEYVRRFDAYIKGNKFNVLIEQLISMSEHNA